MKNAQTKLKYKNSLPDLHLIPSVKPVPTKIKYKSDYQLDEYTEITPFSNVNHANDLNALHYN